MFISRSEGNINSACLKHSSPSLPRCLLNKLIKLSKYCCDVLFLSEDSGVCVRIIALRDLRWGISAQGLTHKFVIFLSIIDLARLHPKLTLNKGTFQHLPSIKIDYSIDCVRPIIAEISRRLLSFHILSNSCRPYHLKSLSRDSSAMYNQIYLCRVKPVKVASN